MGSGSRSLSTALFIAWRYFFSRKSTQAIHVIAIVAVTAIAIVTMVMVVALSVFNGFERFTTDQFATLCPTTEIRSDVGQDYSASAVTLPPGVTAAPVLTTQALAKCGDNAMPVTLIGIDSTYQQVVPIADHLVGGDFDIGDEDYPSAVLGVGVAAQLGAGVGYQSPLTIVLPKRLGRMSTILPQRSFVTRDLYVGGVFQVDDEEADEQAVYVPIALLRELLMYDSDVVTYLATDHTDDRELTTALGLGYRVLDIYEQNPQAYRVLEIEKWITFLLLVFVLILCLFSVISTLGLLIVEKRDDTQVLLSLGATPSTIDSILHIESYLLTLSGLVIGLVTGILLVLSQATWGWLKLGGDASLLLIDAYPVELRVGDLLMVSAIILLVGWISSRIAFRLFSRGERKG
ncbi:ABC transporter permease [uncultured Porphyromonas sp.]|uniref:ABC transporter permease n=2 Tax=uncultured Porphyromonas sp. TaxID=159274 RepID=UPI00261907F8|nr:ABC transporter permease [uncultured Porphyromonas sp.]